MKKYIVRTYYGEKADYLFNQDIIALIGYKPIIREREIGQDYNIVKVDFLKNKKLEEKIL